MINRVEVVTAAQAAMLLMLPEILLCATAAVVLVATRRPYAPRAGRAK
jgi:hypothetical protein